MFAYNEKNQVETLWERHSQFVSDAKLENSATANGTAAIGAGDAAGDVVSSADDAKGQELIDNGGTGPLIQEALTNYNSFDELQHAG